jgi:hypothetical protein
MATAGDLVLWFCRCEQDAAVSPDLFEAMWSARASPLWQGRHGDMSGRYVGPLASLPAAAV